MKRRISIALVGLALVGCFTSLEVVHGSGVRQSEVRVMTPFERIRISAPFEVQVRVGGESLVTIEGDDNLLAYVETELDGSRLEIDVRDGFALEPPPRLVIDSVRLRELRVRGSGDAVILGAEGDELLLTIQGSGSIEAHGEVERLSVDIAGSGELRLTELKAGSVGVEIAGSGDVEVDATEELSVSIAGSGDVRYEGNPRVRKSIAGSGAVARLER